MSDPINRRQPGLVARPHAAVDLYWIPLGAGASVVRLSGKAFETISAVLARRQRFDLYHSALVVSLPDSRYVIEQAPVPDSHPQRRGVVAQGPVAIGWLGRFRLFRYEIRCWRDGRIPDIDLAVGSPVRLTEDVQVADRIVAVLPSIPTPVWGRDELEAGEMWNSNSVVAWVLASAGAPVRALRPPPNGRAPGWNAGLAIAARNPGPGRHPAEPRGA